MAELSTFRLLAVASTLVVIGTIGFHNIEGMIADDAGGNHLVNAFYCSAITLTTVGYGDICPSDELTHLGKSFIVMLSFCGLGMFCGPIMDFSASWKDRIPGGVLGPGLFALAFGTSLFMQIEEMEWNSAVYFAIITGTTVGYGDIGPKTDHGRLATALFAILAVNVIGGMLEPAKRHLSELCMETPTTGIKARKPVEETKQQEKIEKKKK